MASVKDGRLMAFTSSKMGLRIWNLLTDLYDHTQLADNWAKVDYHDHSPGKGVQIPTEGLADAAVTVPKLASTVDPSGAYSTYRTYWRGTWNPAVAGAAGTYAIYPGGGVAAGAANSAICIFYIDPADFVNPGRSAYMRMELEVATNGVSPTATWAAALYPITAVSGASGTYPATTLGTLITGSTATVGLPAANTVTRGASIDFAVPVAGTYSVAIVQTGTMTAGAAVAVDVRLAVRAI
jgi:hypothetical protein